MIADKINTPWLGKHPAEWRKTRIKRVSEFSPSFSDGKPDSDEECTILPMEAVSEYGVVTLDAKAAFNDVDNGLTLCENGDVLFAKITPCMENGKGAYVENLTTRYAFGSTEFHVMRPSHEIDGKFLYYVTFNPFFRAWAEKNMHGAAGQQRVPTKFLKYTGLPLPPLPEQVRISTYLDASCASIDRAVESKQKQLETLDALRKSIIHCAVTQGLIPKVTMKESGVDWLGRVPEHWLCESLKRATSRIQTGSTPPTSQPEYYEDGTIAWFSPECFGHTINLRSPKKLINQQAFEDNKVRIFSPDTVLFVGIGATIGKVGILERVGSANQQIVGISCDHRMLGRFLAYQLKNYETIIPKIAQYTTLPILNQTKVGYLPVLRPPIKEQQEICEYLDSKELELAKVEMALNDQMDALTAYRKSIVHECVTGRRRISDVDVAKVEADV